MYVLDLFFIHSKPVQQFEVSGCVLYLFSYFYFAVCSLSNETQVKKKPGKGSYAHVVSHKSLKTYSGTSRILNGGGLGVAVKLPRPILSIVIMYRANYNSQLSFVDA